MFPLDLPPSEKECQWLLPTVQDATDAVREIGEMHLWTDLVCINQQDLEDCNAATQQMDRIMKRPCVRP
jgi:Heterokaryon incompatibility protein (HET)